MKRQLLWAVAVFVAPAVAFAAGGGVSTTSTPGSTSSTSAVTLIIPGIIGVDDESDVEFNFANYIAGGPTDAGCNANTWPLSISCAGLTTVHLDANQAAGAPPALGTTTTIGVPGPPSAVANDTAIWLAVFCSEPVGTFTVEGQISVLTPGSGLTSDNIVTKMSGSNNVFGVGYATFTSFGDNAFHDLGGAFPATFGWSRVDQAVALEFPASTVLVKGTYSATLTYRVTK